MNLCIFHVGMPKTGTTSIQESLYYGLTDPAFIYHSDPGEFNSCRGIHSLFSDRPESHMANKLLGLSNDTVRSYAKKCHLHLERSMSNAMKNRRTLVLSAENGWSLNKEELLRFRDYMHRRNHHIAIMAYLRPWKSMVESNFQQAVKWADGIEFEKYTRGRISYMKPSIINLDQAFGPENVMAIKYDPKILINGCIVRDFLCRWNIPFQDSRIRRSNESLSLPAFKLLYTHRKHFGGPGTGRNSIIRNILLLKRLSKLKGPRPLLDSSIFEPFFDGIHEDRNWIGGRLGKPFEDDLDINASPDCIKNESDLFHHDKVSLEWLASETGSKTAKNLTEVARQVEVLRDRPKFKGICSFMAEAAEKKIARLTNVSKRILKDTHP